MTMANPSHQPLLPSTQAPAWAEELPGAAAGAGTGLQDRGGYLRLPPAFLQVPPPPLPTSPLPAQPHPALGSPGVMLAHHPSLSVQLWHALLTYGRACVDLLLYMCPCAGLPTGWAPRPRWELACSQEAERERAAQMRLGSGAAVGGGGGGELFGEPMKRGLQEHPWLLSPQGAWEGEPRVGGRPWEPGEAQLPS